MQPFKPGLSAAHQATMEANPWFVSLPPAVRDALLASTTLTRLRRGAMLMRQGAPLSASDGFFGLAAGQVKVSNLGKDGREAILTVLEPGNWFGEISLIDGSPRTHDATALSALDVLVMPPDAFAQHMRNAAFSHAIASLLAARLRGIYNWLEGAALLTLRALVARRLLALARGDATMCPQLRHSVHVSQEVLAMMIGVTRQTLSKELNALAQEGMIALGYGRIELLSLDSLQRIGAGS